MNRARINTLGPKDMGRFACEGSEPNLKILFLGEFFFNESGDGSLASASISE